MNRRQVGAFAVAGVAAIATCPVIPSPALAQAAIPGPVLAVITHPVADYATWRAVYEEAEPLRDAAGVTGAEVFLDAANPLTVVIVHRFPSVEAAQACLGNPDLAAAMERGGVTAAPTMILASAA